MQQEDHCLLRCPVCALPTVRLRCTPTAATRSGRCIRPRRRSHRSPSEREVLGFPLGELSPQVTEGFSCIKKMDFRIVRKSIFSSVKSSELLFQSHQLFSGIDTQLAIKIFTVEF